MYAVILQWQAMTKQINKQTRSHDEGSFCQLVSVRNFQLHWNRKIGIIIIWYNYSSFIFTADNPQLLHNHAGQHRLTRRPEQQGPARANAATNGAKQSRQPQPGRGLVGIQQMALLEHTSDKQAYYSFINPGRMKGWVGLVGWPVADGLPT